MRKTLVSLINERKKKAGKKTGENQGEKVKGSKHMNESSELIECKGGSRGADLVDVFP